MLQLIITLMLACMPSPAQHVVMHEQEALKHLTTEQLQDRLRQDDAEVELLEDQLQAVEEDGLRVEAELIRRGYGEEDADVSSEL